MQTYERSGDWLQTFTGIQFWPLDPKPEEIKITDIAHALSNQCRFAGHCEKFYSVAEHSVLVAKVVPKNYALWGLLHDASEAYLTDLPRPVKRNMPEYVAAEVQLMRAVAVRFGLDPDEMPREVHDADNAVLLTEKQQAMKKAPAQWSVTGKPANVSIEFLTPYFAEQRFLDRFSQILTERYN